MLDVGHSVFIKRRLTLGRYCSSCPQLLAYFILLDEMTQAPLRYSICNYIVSVHLANKPKLFYLPFLRFLPDSSSHLQLFLILFFILIINTTCFNHFTRLLNILHSMFKAFLTFLNYGHSEIVVQVAISLEKY